jgi:hypothetical protein
VLIAKSQLLQSQDLAINPGPPISQNAKEGETQPLQFPFEIENDFFFDADCGNTLNSHFQKIPTRKHNLNPLKKGSPRKLPKPTSSHTSNSYVGQQEKFKDGIACEAIEGETSNLEIIPNLSSSMPTTNIYFEPIFKPNLDPNDPPYESFDDPIIDSGDPLIHPKHGSHEGYKSDLEE